MAEYLELHPITPQKRLIDMAIKTLNDGGIIFYPTDTSYGFACAIDNAKGIERLIQMRKLSPNHLFTIVCHNLSEASAFASIDDWTFRILKRCLPGPYTFVLNAKREVPKKILPKRKTVGIRIPDHPICHLLLEGLGRSILSTTAKLPGQEIISDPSDNKEELMRLVDMVIDAGVIPWNASTIVDVTGGIINVIRQGIGDIDSLGLD